MVVTMESAICNFLLTLRRLVVRIIDINAYTMSAKRCYPKQKNTSHLDTRGFVHLCFLCCSSEGHSGHNRPRRRGPAEPNLHTCPAVTYSFLTSFAEDLLQLPCI